MRQDGHRGADIIAVDIAGGCPDCVPVRPGERRGLAETVALVCRAAHPAVVDIRDLADGLQNSCRTGCHALGRLDVIVANAGISPPAAWDAITPEAFRDVHGHQRHRHLEHGDGGAPTIIEGGAAVSIILIARRPASKMQPFAVHYTTSKHAVTGMARAFAAELAGDIRSTACIRGRSTPPWEPGHGGRAEQAMPRPTPQLHHMLTRSC